jgi:hypothetical protein
MQSVARIVDTKHSSYLENVLLPETSPVSIPDDVNVRHIVKSDVISSNFVTDGSDYFCAFALAGPSDVIGGVVPYDSATGQPVGTQIGVQASQKYGDFFNLSRHISADLKLTNNTVSTTNFTVSGLANACQVPMKLHEMIKYNGAQNPVPFALPTYDRVLSLASTGSDKAGGVKMASGVVALGLPGNFDVPFSALNGGVGANNGAGVPGMPVPTNIGVANSTMGTSEFDDVYTAQWGVSATPASLQIPCTSYDSLVKVEAIFSSNVASTVAIRARYIDSSSNTFDVVNIGTALTSYVGYVRPWSSANSTLKKILVAIEFVYNAATTSGNGSAIITVCNGNLPGCTAPTTLVSMVGVQPGCQIAIEGHKNTELVPNESLAQNLPTAYPYYDPLEMEYVRRVMAKREELGIRAVYSGLDYMEKKSIFREIADLKDSSTVQAEAMEILPILNSIRKVATPIVGSLLPSARPYIDAVNAGFDAILPVANAIIDPSRPRNAYAMEEDVYDDPRLLDEYVHIMRMIPEDKPLSSAIPVQLENRHAVLFPTVVTQGTEKLGVMMYAAVSGRVEPWDKTCSRAGTHFVYNYEGPVPMNLPFDVTMIPLVAVSRTELAGLPMAPHVQGQSCMAALRILPLTKAGSVSRTAVTGALMATPLGNVLTPSTTYSYKKNKVEQMGLELITPESYLYTRGIRNAPNELVDRLSAPPDNPVNLAPPFVYSEKSRVLAMESSIQSPLGLPPLRGDFIKDAYNAMTYVTSIYPGNESLPYVVEWIIRNGLLSTMTKMMEDDPTGVATRGTTKVKGPDQDTAGRMKAMRLYEALKSQYSRITPEWIMANGNVGPSTAQAQYYSAKQELPPPGEPVEQLVPAEIATGQVFDEIPGPTGKELATLSKDPAGKIEARIRNDAKLTPSAKSALRQFVKDHGRSVTAAEYNHIRSIYASDDAQAASRVDRLAPKAPPPGLKHAGFRPPPPASFAAKYTEFDDDEYF